MTTILKRPWHFFPLLFLFGMMMSPLALFAQEPLPQRQVDDKTFQLRNGVWIDTAYVPSQHPIYRLGRQAPQFAQFAHSLGEAAPFATLGDHYLVVHQGWGIEVMNGRDAGPLVPTETGRPPFVQQPLPTPNPPTLISGAPHTIPPKLLATTPRQGITIQLQMSWAELIAVSVFLLLLGAGIWGRWQERREVQEEGGERP